MLDSVAEKILALRNPDAQIGFAKALHASIDLKPGASASLVASPTKIHQIFGVSVSDQVQFDISLTRTTAHEFLLRNGKKITQERIKRLVKDEHFQSMFGRTGCRFDDRGTYVLTYAELFHLVEFPFDIPFPASLKTLVR